MSEKRRGLGRGLGALIPSNAAPVTRPAGDRPVDVFFPDRDGEGGEPTGSDRELAASVVGRPAGAASAASASVVTARSGLGTATPTTLPPLPGGPFPASFPSPLPPAPGPSTEPVTGPSGAPSTVPSTVPSTNTSTVPSTVPSPDVPTDTPSDPPPAPPGEGPQAELAGGIEPTGDADDLVPVPGAYFAEIPVADIRPNPKQPRQVFDEEALAELVQSVKEIGVLQPVVVRRVPEADEASGGVPQFELIMGERRLRACREAGLERIPAIVRDTQDDALLRDALLENLHRSQLNPLEEAAAYQQLLDDFGCTHEELATRIGRSRPQISNTLRLLKLPPLVQRRVAAAVLSAGHARALLGLEDHAAMERLAQRIVAEGLSVRAVEEIVALGDGTVANTPKRRPRAGNHTSELDDLAARLGDRLDTKVAIALGRTKGKVSIEFASVDDLNRILGLLSPEVRGAFRET